MLNKCKRKAEIQSLPYIIHTKCNTFTVDVKAFRNFNDFICEFVICKSQAQEFLLHHISLSKKTLNSSAKLKKLVPTLMMQLS